MIPIQLKIRNFLSYGDTEQLINFEPYTLMCLSGKNGHGKSALLDAITWSVWGHARKVSGVSRADEALIRLGNDKMSVQFDFLCQGERYSVYRELVLCGSKARSTLEFGLYDQSEKKLKPLTEKTIRATQQKIEEIVGLNFETFANSVFLRQGQANEFSKKSARERKEILALILGLDYYERIRKVVLEKIRERASKRDGLKQLLELLNEEVDELKTLEETLGSLEHEEVVLKEEAAALVVKQKEVQKDRDELYSHKEKIYLLERVCAQNGEKLQVYNHAYELKCTQVHKEQEVLGARLLSQCQAAEERHSYIEKQKKTLDDEFKSIRKVLTNYEKELARKDQITKSHVAARELFERRKDVYQRMIGNGNLVDRELRIVLDHEKQASSCKDSVCPLCEQSLSGKTREQLKYTLKKKVSFYQHRLRRIKLFVQESKDLLMLEHGRIKELEKEVQHIITVESQYKDISVRSFIIHTEFEKHVKVLTQSEETKKRLKEQAYVVQQKLQELKNKQQNELEQDIQYKKLLTQRQIAEQDLAQFKKNVSFDQKETEFKEREIEIQQLMLQHTEKGNQLLQQKTRLEHEQLRIQKLSIERKKYEVTKKSLESEIAEYKVISEALGKDGIQALLIESVIPEIEEEANKLLAQLSDQNAQIMIESVRDLKKGGTRETLDIKISDNAGIRPYELFSGGEAFRLDFALRIAISKLLARRAGASLQTLIIDEGFGSQDEDGLSLIMDALYKIQDDFAKIIVVSHLSTMKDQFPVHFFIEKTALGSLVRVIEQG